MPKKTIRKEKSREYLERLLDNAGMTDKELVQTVVKALKSDNSIERSKALELAARWKGFADVDKKVEESVERLPIGNISLADLDRLSNRCAYCKHKRFEPLREATNKKETPGIPVEQEESAMPKAPGCEMPEPESARSQTQEAQDMAPDSAVEARINDTIERLKDPKAAYHEIDVQYKEKEVKPDVKYRIGGKIVSREEFYSIKDNEQNKEKAADTSQVIGNSQD